MQTYFSVAIFAFFCVNFGWPCALPFWWSEQFHFPPYYPTGQPKSTYKYHETLQADPNNYIRIREYSEYTWWEHDTSKNNEQNQGFPQHNNVPNKAFPQHNNLPNQGFIQHINNVPNQGFPQHNNNAPNQGFPQHNNNVPNQGFPQHNNNVPNKGFPQHNNNVPNKGFPQHNNNVPHKGFPQHNNVPNQRFPQPNVGNDMDNVFFSNDGRFKGFYPQNNYGFNNDVGSPHGDTNNIVPRGDNDMITPVDTNNMVPSDKTDRISPTASTNDMESSNDDSLITTTTENTAAERERNENENENENQDVTMLENLERNDLEAGSESKATYKLPEKKQKGNFFSGWFGTQDPNKTEPCKVSGSDILSLRGMIEKMFSLPREHEMHPESKEKAREDIMNKFRELGLQVWTQNFTTHPMKNKNGTEESEEGVNLIGVIPGAQRGHLDDEIVLVGAHYDTVADSNGVDDNGSGLAVMLEVAKAITEARCRLNHTLMFVAFDHEENGAMGSNYFVDHYLIPEELKRARGKFQGAFILDGILNYNDVPNTQELPLDYAETLPGLQYFVNNTGNRGNFLAMISRNEMDKHLSQKLMDAWKDLGDHQYKLFNLAVDMGNEIPSPPVIEKHLNFLRSDHATFWYHNSSSHFPESLNAVLLTDTGPFRGQMKECYHNKCDDLTVMSPEKLQFAKKTADALTATLVELTRATASGYQIQATPLLYIFHAFMLFYTLKLVY